MTLNDELLHTAYIILTFTFLRQLHDLIKTNYLYTSYDHSYLLPYNSFMCRELLQFALIYLEL